MIPRPDGGFIMETGFIGAWTTIKEFQTNMKNHMLKMIKGISKFADVNPNLDLL